MSRPDVSLHGLAHAALEREQVAIAGKRLTRIRLPDFQLQLQAGVGGITHLVDAKTGERLGCAIDATVLERTRIFFR